MGVYDEDRSVQTRLGREDSEYLARRCRFMLPINRWPISVRCAWSGNGRRALSKTETAGLCAADTRQQININTLDVAQSVILEACLTRG